ncbi:MAG: hypothetical protein AAFY56_15990 [Pseudomonadota bacterium]
MSRDIWILDLKKQIDQAQPWQQSPLWYPPGRLASVLNVVRNPAERSVVIKRFVNVIVIEDEVTSVGIEDGPLIADDRVQYSVWNRPTADVEIVKRDRHPAVMNRVQQQRVARRHHKFIRAIIVCSYAREANLPPTFGARWQFTHFHSLILQFDGYDQCFSSRLADLFLAQFSWDVLDKLRVDSAAGL